MARTRTTKKLAQRIDLNYFMRPTPLKRAKLWLNVTAPALALAWILAHGLARDSQVYSSGRMSEAHAVLESECTACHIKTVGAFSARASDTACLACHDGPMHHATTQPTRIWPARNAPSCAACHTEHRGRVNLVAMSNETCTQCHADLQDAAGRSTEFAKHIESLENGHPEFAALRTGSNSWSYPRTILLNHALHMKPLRRGPTGPNVQLECGNCHRTQAAGPDLTYSDARYRAEATTKYQQALMFSPDALQSARPATGRELMATVKFANACAACHLLTFDERFDFGVPHDEPEVVHKFLIAKFSEYIRAHPAELGEARDPKPELARKPTAGNAHAYRSSEWLAARVYDAEQLLWRKTCRQCHALGFRVEGTRPPVAPWLTMRPADILTAPVFPTILWGADAGRRMPHATFDHDAHRGFSCISCHEKAVTSMEASDVLLPGIVICKTCHAPGQKHAESRCFECHTYHDWSERKEVKPTFTLRGLRTGGK